MGNTFTEEAMSYQEWIDRLNAHLRSQYGDHLDAENYPASVLECGWHQNMTPAAFFSWAQDKRFEEGAGSHHETSNPGKSGTTAKLFGGIVLGVSILAFLNVKPQLDQVNTVGGQAALALSGLVSRGASDAQAQIQSWQLTYNLSIVGMLVGALVLVIGFVQGSRPD